MADDIRKINGLPNNGQSWHENDYDSARLKNQYAVAGATGLKSPYFGDKNASVFLEYVQADAAFTIKDKDGNTLFSALTSPFDLSHAAMRLDGGFELTGANFQLVKGFVLRG